MLLQEYIVLYTICVLSFQHLYEAGPTARPRTHTSHFNTKDGMRFDQSEKRKVAYERSTVADWTENPAWPAKVGPSSSVLIYLMPASLSTWVKSGLCPLILYLGKRCG